MGISLHPEEIMPLSLKSRACGNAYVIHCHGRIVAGVEADSLEAALQVAERETNRVVLCVSEVDRLDSIGIGLLVRYATRFRKRGGDLRLAAPRPFLTSLLELTLLTAVLPAHPTEEDALLSVLQHRAASKSQEKHGPHVLVLDQSADLCGFVRTVLMQQGFDVRSANYFHDAKILLQVDPTDYILVGPDTPQLCYESVLGSLKALAPKATTLQLAADFKCQDAMEATGTLLQLFGLQPHLVAAKSPAS
jgi:anti-anti-sigma factor